ncbi:uncharacterized protein [Venturia canescens]|uniref:uncharacterized protein n=1 Tax=Venturia canescens TaxID=32260 RepID=UPI001C9BC264|nr:uncharacterized protein LOC122406224 [Venturia canescens]XP_043267470.1 uncharacterized protein LOC122406224 [Venturia canescens]XP_043267471.1 uncharacterized protein LOC122406224 [Venturia canescens]XP_043267472.1 uncharacterized protein LOC122406224 [Venturia canescens]
MFPVEIWEEILKHIDPIDLVRFRRVCKCWCDIIQKILEQPDIWYEKCQKDVPSGFWRLILEQKNYSIVNWRNFHAAKYHLHVWKSLFKSWLGWRNLVHQSYEIEKLKPIPKHRPMERITCMAALSDSVAVGTSEGYVTIFNLRENSTSKVDRTIFLEDLTLWKNGVDHLIVSTTAVNKVVMHWNVYEKVSEIQLRGTLMSAGSQYCYSIIGNQLTRVSAEIKDSIELVEVLWDLPKLGKIVAMCADVRKVFLWSDTKQYIQFYIEENSAYYKVSKRNDPRIEARYYHCFKPCIVSCIGVLGEIGFSVAGRQWKIYQVFSKFLANVTSVLFHIGVLVLGLESGEIHLFAIENIYALEKLNFDTLRSKKLILDTSPIIYLKAMENDLNQYIVAATDAHVYVVKFDSL